MRYKVKFYDPGYTPVELERGAVLSEHLHVKNSPLLFGCRTGVCGTCLVRVEGELPPAGEDEKEMLEVLAPDDGQARLACRLSLVGDICIGPHPEAG